MEIEAELENMKEKRISLIEELLQSVHGGLLFLFPGVLSKELPENTTASAVEKAPSLW